MPWYEGISAGVRDYYIQSVKKKETILLKKEGSRVGGRAVHSLPHVLLILEDNSREDNRGVLTSS